MNRRARRPRDRRPARRDAGRAVPAPIVRPEGSAWTSMKRVVVESQPSGCCSPTMRGHIIVTADLSVRGAPGSWAVGDRARPRNGRDIQAERGPAFLTEPFRLPAFHRKIPEDRPSAKAVQAACGMPSSRFAGTATSISVGRGSLRLPISSTNAARSRPTRRALCRFSCPIVDTVLPL